MTRQGALRFHGCGHNTGCTTTSVCSTRQETLLCKQCEPTTWTVVLLFTDTHTATKQAPFHPDSADWLQQTRSCVLN